MPSSIKMEECMEFEISDIKLVAKNIVKPVAKNIVLGSTGGIHFMRMTVKAHLSDMYF